MTSFLLDTHIFLWMISEEDKLSRATQDMLTNSHYNLFLSVASLWEIGIKYQIGKLGLPKPPQAYIPKHLAQNDVQLLSIEPEHALTLYKLPTYHSDPFDRLIINQSLIEKMPIISSDPYFKKYEDIKVMWN